MKKAPIKKPHGSIHETLEYDRFRYSPDQRNVKTSHVKDIMDSMDTWGFLASKPVQTYEEKDQYVIVDGHHRFVAAKNLQIPILFVVEDKSHADSIGHVNGLQRKWVLANFVSMYAKRGIADYKELSEYSKLGIPLSSAASFLSGNAAAGRGNPGNFLSKSLFSGTFKVKTREKIEMLASFLRDQGHNNPAYASRNFIGAFELLTRVPDFDFDKLASKLSNNPKSLEKTATIDQMLDQIEEIYNYRQSIKVPLAFAARQAKKR